MARYIIAYVCPGVDKRDPSWVLGALANDETGYAIATNPNLDVDAVAEATELAAETLQGWEAAMRSYLDQQTLEIFEAGKGYTFVPPTDPRFLDLVAADSVGEWNYYYSKVAERPGAPAVVAQQVARGG